MKGKYLQFGLGLIVGGLLCGTTATAAANLTASPTSQTFYINGQKVEFEAYVIHGNNFVKLRDIGQAVDFGVIYDGNTNSVYIDPNSPYQEEVKQTEQDTGTPSVLTEEYVQATIARAGLCCVRMPHLAIYRGGGLIIPAGRTSKRAMSLSIKTPIPATRLWYLKRPLNRLL